jgi:hypothetical protein
MAREMFCNFSQNHRIHLHECRAMKNKNHILILPGIVLLSGALMFCGCETFVSDAATRLAYQIRDEAATLRRSGAATRTFEHRPKEWPQGVSGDYAIHIGQSIGVLPTMSSTTHHLNFVAVPKNLSISHRKGEPTLITLQMKDGKVLLTDLR